MENNLDKKAFKRIITFRLQKNISHPSLSQSCQSLIESSQNYLLFSILFNIKRASYLQNMSQQIFLDKKAFKRIITFHQQKNILSHFKSPHISFIFLLRNTKANSFKTYSQHLPYVFSRVIEY